MTNNKISVIENKVTGHVGEILDNTTHQSSAYSAT